MKKFGTKKLISILLAVAVVVITMVILIMAKPQKSIAAIKLTPASKVSKGTVAHLCEAVTGSSSGGLSCRIPMKVNTGDTTYCYNTFCMRKGTKLNLSKTTGYTDKDIYTSEIKDKNGNVTTSAVHWIFDNIYLDYDGGGVFSNTGVTPNAEELEYYRQNLTDIVCLYYSNKGKTYNRSDVYNSIKSLSEGRIFRAQQIAIWRFVNSKSTSDAYANSGLKNGIQKDIYYALTTIAETKLTEGYISPNSDVNTRIPTINTANAKLNTANSLIGPFTISNNNNLFSKELVTTLIVNNGDTILKNSKIVDKDGNEIANFNGTLYNSNKLYNGEFYIKLIDCEQIFSNENLSINVNVDFNLKGYTTTGKYWTKSGYQPLATLQREPVDLNYNLPITRNATDLDLALKKTIRIVEQVSGNKITYNRLDNIDTTPLDNGETDALYSMQKYPVDVEVGDIVTYEIRVYNESTEIDAAAIEIVDYLPEGLDLADNLDNCVTTSSGEISYKYEKDKKSIIITYENSGTGNNPGVIKRYTINGGSENLNGRSIFVKCKVVEGATDILTNTAEITAFGYINTNGEYKTAVYNQDKTTYINDRDSIVANWNSPNGKAMGYTEEYAYAIKNSNSVVDRSSYAWRNYADAQQDWVNDGGFHNFTGQQDDDDFEKLRVKQPDIALRKFIVSVKNDVDGETVYEGQTGRFNSYSVSGLNLGFSDAFYFMKKNPVEVKIGDTVTYAIRIFNEGEVLAKASKVVDYLPEGVSFKKAYLQLEEGSEKLELSATEQTSIPGTVEYVEDSKMVKFTYSGNLLNSFDPEQDTLDYYTFYIECEVEPEAKGILTNVTEITEYELAGNRIITTDIDSTSGNWDILPLDKADGASRLDEEWIDYSNSRDLPDEIEDWIGQEDDDDFEKIYVKYQYMDLALRKNITFVQKEDSTVIRFDNEYSEQYDANIDTRIEKRKPTLTDASWEEFDPSAEGHTTLEYYHAKDVVTIQKGDIIRYNITVYNEGTLNATDIKIGDYLPAGLKLAENSSINASIGWEYTNGYGVEDLEDNGFIAIETVVKNNDYNAVLNQIDLENQNVDFISIPVELEVTDVAIPNKYFINRAEIKDAIALDDSGNELSGVKDIDSEYNSIFEELDDMSDEEVADYFDNYYDNYDYTGVDDAEQSYFPGVEDDDDFETIYLYQPIDNKYNLKLIKVDALTGETLDGIKFEITGLNLGNNTSIIAEDDEIANKEYTTGPVTSSVQFNGKTYTNGIIEINNIKIEDTTEDLYKFVEKEFPDGMYYNFIDGEFMVTFTSDAIGNVTPNEIIDITSGEILETYIDKETNTVIALIPNEKVLGKYSLNIQKQDGEGAPIDLPAVFTIKYPDGTVKDIETKNGKIEIAKDVEFTEPGTDTYIVIEKIAPEGYVKESSPITITVEKYFDETTNKFEVRILNSKITNAEGKEYEYFEDGDSTFVVGVPNIPITGEYKIRIRKVDLNNPDKGLEGVTFTIATPLGANNVVTDADGYTEPVTIPIGTKFTSVYTVDKLQVTEGSLGQYEGKYNKVTDVMPVYVYKGISNWKYVVTGAYLTKTDLVTGNWMQVTLDDGTKTRVLWDLQDNLLTITVPNKEIKYPDLSLEKFITAVTTGEETKEITDREPVFSKDETVTDGDGYVYTPKYEDLEAVEVNSNDIVTYTLRVYNEGEMDAYAAEIIDDIPEGVEFVPYTVGDGSVNDTYRWVMYKVVTDAEIAQLPAGTEIKELNGKTQNGETVFEKCIVTDNPAEADYAVTDYLSKEQGEARMDGTTNENPNLLKAFEPTTPESLENGPDSRDVKIQFKVTREPATKEEAEELIVNFAQISKDTDKNGNEITDRDSTENVWTDGEDDQDKEKIKVKYKYPDLSLEKFITAVTTGEETNEITDREPVFKKDNTVTNGDGYVYTPKYENLAPVQVNYNDIVTYTLRVYNEGEIDAYAAEIIDDIPEGVEFVPYTIGDGSVNDTYRWVMYKVVTDAEIALLPAGTEVKELNGKTQNGVIVYDKCVVTNDPAEADYAVTDYLSKEQGEARMDETTNENPNLLKAFEPTTQEKLEKGPDSRDVKIQFKVTHKPTTKEEADNTIINHAQISKDTDKNGEEITDRDSTENVWTDGEDDQDREKIKVNYFDLAEVKWVSEAIIIEDGVERVEKGNVLEELQNQYDHRLIYAMYPDTIGQYTDLEPVVKVDIPESKIDSVVVKFKYKIRVYNEGQIDGYAKEITDYIPDGMKFVQEDNPLWKDIGDGKVVTNQLADKLLTVGGEPETIEIVYTWINSKENIGLKVNVAEISADYNEYGTPDVDSKPNNVTPGEDDIDDAPVLLSIRTGETVRTEYIVLGIAVVALITTGVVLIKKFVI